MRYVFSITDTVRYRFPTHVNELVLDRSESTVTEVFIVVLEPVKRRRSTSIPIPSRSSTSLRVKPSSASAPGQPNVSVSNRVMWCASRRTRGT